MIDLSKYKKTGTTTPAAQPVKPLDLSKYKKQEPNFLQSVLGDIYTGASTVGATIEQPLAAGAAVVGQKLGQGIGKIIGKETKPVESYNQALQRIRSEDAQFMKTNLPSSFKYQPAKTPLEFAGAVLETGANVAGGGAVKNLATQGFRKSIVPLAKEGAAIVGSQTLGKELREGQGIVGSIPSALGGAAIGAVGGPVIGGAGALLSKGLTRYVPSVAKTELPKQFPMAVADSQANLDKVLDNLVIPNVTPNAKTRDTISYVRSQFPNLQEEVAIRSGQPIKTVNENGKIKFQTANQADVIQQKAYTESQNAAQIAKQFDETTNVSNDLLKSKLDSVLSQTNTPNVAGIREKALKILDNEATISPKGLKPSKVDDLRSKAGLESNRYDADGNLVGDADVYSILSKVYKEALSDTIKDPNYQTMLRNSADNFELARLLKTLHNKEAVTPRTGLSNVVSKVGSGVETVGRILPFQVGSPVEYLGKFIKYLPEFNSAERALISKEVENIVKRAGQVGANLTDSETRVLNFVKRLEQTNKAGTPIQVNIDDINALKGLENVKKYEDAVKLFNKRFGEEVLTPDDNFGIDLVKFYDRMQGASSKQKADITAELYKEILKGNKTTAKTVLPPAKPQEIKLDLNTPSKKLPTIKEAEAIDEVRFYDNLAKQGKTEPVVPLEVMQERIDELTKKIGERRVSKEITQQAYDNLKDSFAGGGFNFKVYAQMRNAGARDIESLNKAGLGEQGAAVLRQLEDYAGDKDISEMMAQADEILDLAKQVREPVGTKDLISERKRLISDAMVEKARAVLNKSGKPTEYRTLGITTEELQPLAEEAGQTLDTLNPTGSIFAEYTPQQRVNLPLGKNITTYDKTAGLNPDDIVTIYRGTGEGKSIVPGDFITTNKQLAKDYAGTGKVIEKKVKAKDILDDITEPMGEEYIYRPKVNNTQGISKELLPLAEEAKKITDYAEPERLANGDRIIKGTNIDAILREKDAQIAKMAEEINKKPPTRTYNPITKKITEVTPKPEERLTSAEINKITKKPMFFWNNTKKVGNTTVETKMYRDDEKYKILETGEVFFYKADLIKAIIKRNKK